MGSQLWSPGRVGHSVSTSYDHSQRMMTDTLFSDVPQDLSAKFKTVSVQTDRDDSSSEMVKDLLSGFSERQVQLLLGVLTQILWRNNNQEIPEPSHQLFAGIEKELHKPRQSGWTPLEPETPPISPPLNSLLQLTARNSSSASLSTPSTTTSTSASRTLHDRVLHQPPPLNKLFNTRTESSTACIQNQRYSSDGDNEDGSTGGLSRDEKLVSEMNIPCTVEDIIHKPMEEFNDLLSRYSVSEEVINICRDIRRRGKNKIAAQNCRKRKVEQIYSLEEDLHDARNKKKIILTERAELLRVKQEWMTRLIQMERSLLRSAGKTEKCWRVETNLESGTVSILNDPLSV